MGGQAGRPRSSVGLGIALAASLPLAVACNSSSSSDPEPGPAGVAALEAHVLDRIGYGPDAWTLERIRALGVEPYIEEQLEPASIPDPEIDALLAAHPELALDYHDLVETYPLGSDEQADPLLALTRVKLLRAVRSHRQLEQVLVDFWFDHFNVYARDAVTLHDTIPYERKAIRPHVLGRFEDMLLAVARSPAMLYYLDNYLSAREGFEYRDPSGTLLISGLNENYARELLELHTVGVDGGYDQTDVIEVARAFTGWMIGPRAQAGPDGFLFVAPAHDTDPKSVMGALEIDADGGVEEGETVLGFLARHPSTAEFICTKLAVRFVDEQPPVALVERCADAYLDRGGHLGDATRAILLSSEFLDARRARNKVKRPLHFAASLARATGADLDVVISDPGEAEVTVADGLIFYLELLGEPLYAARPPTGHPDTSQDWAGGGALVQRFNLAWLVAQADELIGIDWEVDGDTDARITDSLGVMLMPGGLSAATRDSVVRHLQSLPPTPLTSRVRETGALLLSSPDFMRH